MASTIKVDNVQNQPGTNIVNKCGTTITLGACGDTVSLASGASQTGFGRTGTVDWETTPKTATFSAVSGKGYFCNTTAGAFEVDLPAGTAGAIVSVQDYNNTFDSNDLTVDPNGSEKINGGTAGDPILMNTEGQGVTFVYVDSTVGWRSIHENQYTTAGSAFVSATGGTIVTNGDFKTHIFTGPGTFTVTAAGSPGGSDTVDYFVVAGGGGGGGAGGGAGGFRLSNSTGCVPAPTMSPLVAPAALPVTATTYPITVGAGGAGVCTGNPPYTTSGDAAQGASSIFSSITSAGGGRGGKYTSPGKQPGSDGGPGGSGGAGAYGNTGPSTASGGTGNDPPVSPVQGTNGGSGNHQPGVWANTGSGGGAGGAGVDATNPQGPGVGGIGSFLADTVIGPTAPSYGTPGPVSSTRYFAGGGSFCGAPGVGGAGGGGNSYSYPSPGPATSSKPGTVNTGGGGGGGGAPCTAAASGGSGIIMIRYKFQ